MAAIAAPWRNLRSVPCRCMRVSKPAFLRHTRSEFVTSPKRGRPQNYARRAHGNPVERQNGTEGTWKAADGHPQPIEGKWVSASHQGCTLQNRDYVN